MVRLHEGKVKKVVALSTDKAVNPVNLGGPNCALIRLLCSKAMRRYGDNLFSGKVRNVVGSRGALFLCLRNKEVWEADYNQTKMTVSDYTSKRCRFRLKSLESMVEVNSLFLKFPRAQFQISQMLWLQR